MIFNGREIGGIGTSVGMDIEFPVKNTRGNFVSAIPFVSGTKDSPDYCDGGNTQRDNIALEIAIDQAYDSYTFINQMRSNLQNALNILPKGYTMGHESSVLYPKKELKHEEAQEFGCLADYDAKTGNANKFNLDIIDPLLRSFGLHVHTGIGRGVDTRAYILISDFVLGLFSTLKDNSEISIRRRILYGKPSCYRDKDYGVEYRTLSNFWARSPRLIKTIWMLNNIVYDIFTCQNIGIVLDSVDIHELSDIILTGNDVRAGELFFEHIFDNLDFQTQRKLIDELDYKDYKPINTEWSLSTKVQPETLYDAYRDDYFKQPECKEVLL